MTDLIQISKTSINGTEINSISARDLHSSLEIKKQFGDWIKQQIQYFEENSDFLKLHLKGERKIEYVLTLDTAKHIAMMSRTLKGREVRHYFIEAEKKLSTKIPHLPQNYIEALEALTIAEKEKLSLSNTIQEKDKVILAVADLNIRAGNVSISDFSKNLAIENLGRNNLFSWLKGRGFLMMNTEPYQQYVERGYFVRKPSEKKINGEVRYITMLTPRGTVWLTKILHAEFELDEVA